jgi:hypothetical protein
MKNLVALFIGLFLALAPVAHAGSGVVTEKPTITKVLATSGNVAAGVAAASIPAVSGRLNYITGFSITGTGATAGQAVVVTVTGLLGGTITFTIASVTGATVGNAALNYEFPHPVPASAINTAITVSCATLGAGSTNNVTNVFGYTE